MSEKEKQAAEEVVTSLRAVPADAEDYIRGYLKGRLDEIRARKSKDADSIPA
jgi:3-methyladenine DNA glycosylase AlkC